MSGSLKLATGIRLKVRHKNSVMRYPANIQPQSYLISTSPRLYVLNWDYNQQLNQMIRCKGFKKEAMPSSSCLVESFCRTSPPHTDYGQFLAALKASNTASHHEKILPDVEALHTSIVKAVKRS